MVYMVQIDWIEKAWPRHLKELQEDNTNNIEEMMYPKVCSNWVLSDRILRICAVFVSIFSDLDPDLVPGD